MKIGTIFILISSILFQEPTNTFLANPFDLQKFKKAKGQSNSGGADVQPYYYRPEGKGVYYRFFIFRSPNTFIYSGNETQKYPIRYGMGFQIVTYKPLGKYRDAYLDPTETLIELEASYNDPDMPQLAFIGLDTTRVKMKLGTNFLRKENSFIYSYNKNVLVLRISEDRKSVV